ncbi:stonustoxin subunit alpha-like [Sinocyclocheilus grahami]|uniref:stonustoxin subunit alpha-like n=1 Tax=Sinocyclocheilus grahami TaxID=75366 RepID=UPI0007AC8D2C|nr:PREDICTED: stonustoxin subunit alpha-like [Sinocyclocheilus grahami]
MRSVVTWSNPDVVTVVEIISVAYGGCEVLKREKEIQQVRIQGKVTYAEAVRIVSQRGGNGKRSSPGKQLDKDSDQANEEKVMVDIKKLVTFISPASRYQRTDMGGDGCFLTLDPNTANAELSLSEENRKVTDMRERQSYPRHPDRFDDVWQVLCRESVCGRCYWEIEWSGVVVYISVSYKSISRKGWGVESVFGSNDQSWCLFCSSSSYSFRHNDIETALSVKPISSRRIGVFVDHSAGTLSFYSVSHTMSLIHTVQTTFTQPLCAGVYVYKSSVKLC